MPFNVQELNAVGGNYYGINQISKNINVGNRKGLINGNGFIFGVPGSGKSFFAKQEMGNVFLNTQDDVIVIDPMNEYFDIADTFGGAIVNLSAYTKNYVNPLAADLAHMNERGIRDVIADKSEFMLSLCDQLLGNALNQKHHSIIDRCIRELYMRAWKVKKVPVMTDFYHILKSQKEMEAQELALSLELFVEGSLNIFNHQTNVDVDNRFTVYGIQDLGSQLAPVAMLVMMEAIQQRIIDNGKRGRATWLYIDECHVLLNSDYSATYLQQLWKKVRKQGGLCTGITQNVVDLLQNYIAMTLLSNSEFVALLKQANVDSAKLAEVIGVSDAQLQYVHNSPSGTGLLKCGSVVIPFDNQISKDSDLYKLYNTNIHEKIAMGMVGEDSIFHGYHSDEMTEDFSEADDGTQDSVFTSDEWNGDSDLDEALETDVKIYEPVRSKPSSIEQREGRGLRQGNENSEVAVYRYVTKGTFDAYSWSLVENKQRFISQVMTSKSISRSCEDIDEATLSYAEIKAVATGNPLIKEKMEVDNEVQRLKMLKASYDSQHYSLQDQFMIKFPKLIAAANEKLNCVHADIKKRDEQVLATDEEFAIKVGNMTFHERVDGGTAVLAAVSKCKVGETTGIGEYRGFEVQVEKNFIGVNYLILHGRTDYKVELSNSPVGCMVKLENCFNGMDGNIEFLEKKLEQYQRDMEQAKAEYEKPFAYEEELKSKTARQFELNTQLDLENKSITEKNGQEISQVAENDYPYGERKDYR